MIGRPGHDQCQRQHMLSERLDTRNSQASTEQPTRQKGHVPRLANVGSQMDGEGVFFRVADELVEEQQGRHDQIILLGKRKLSHRVALLAANPPRHSPLSK